VNLKARLKKLERQQDQVSREPFRVVVTRVGERFDLAKATCSRTLMPDGRLVELVKLPGSRDSMSDEDLERFIQSHPIQGPR
jgi:hypothetical protein